MVDKETRSHLRVESYSGYKGDERPLRFALSEGWVEVTTIEDRWYSPGATYFRVIVSSGERYVLSHDDAQDIWNLAGYRAAGFGG